MSAPEVSLCLPVYNSSARIERCLRGVLAQQLPAREILVVDNASTDDTVAKARALLAGIPEARIIVNDKNLGRIENWNRCLELATGRYMKFALVNDVLLPGSVEMLMAQARGRPEVTMVCSRAFPVEVMPERPEPVASNPTVQVLTADQTLSRLARESNDTGSLNGTLLNNEHIRQQGLRFRTEIPFWSDFYLAIELANLGKTAYVDANSHLFDKSVKSRFAISGSGANSRSLCFEARECSLLLTRLLPKYGLEPWRGFEFLHSIYYGTSWYGEQPVMGWRDTLALFQGAGPYKTSALKYRFWRSFGPMEHFLKRALSKAGLYRYAWEKKSAE